MDYSPPPCYRQDFWREKIEIVKCAEKLKNDGNDPGAPNNPQILKKFVITTFISLILWAIMYWLLSDDGFLMYVLKSFYIDEIN